MEGLSYFSCIDTLGAEKSSRDKCLQDRLACSRAIPARQAPDAG